MMFARDKRHRWASPITEATRDRDMHKVICQSCGKEWEEVKTNNDPTRLQRMLINQIFKPSPLWWRLTMRRS